MVKKGKEDSKSDVLAISEKYRVYAETFKHFFFKNETNLELLRESVKNKNEMMLAMSVFAQEIIPNDDIFPKGGVYALSYLMRNKDDFFTKRHPTNPISTVAFLFSEICKSADTLDTMASIREQLVIATLGGTSKNKMLRSQHSLYSPDQLILIDSGFNLLFNAAADGKHGKSKGKTNKVIDFEDQNNGPRIFRKLMRQKIQDEKSVAAMKTPELFSLVAYYIINHMEPLANKQ